MTAYETLWVRGARQFTTRILGQLRGVFPLIYIVTNLTFWIGPVLLLAVLKLIVPVSRAQDFFYRAMCGVYGLAVWMDDLLLWRIMGIRYEVRGLGRLHKDRIYLVLPNHQSWADIFLIQSILNFEAPIPKFIVKRELFYLPVVGLICWAYDFPFVARYTKTELRSRPERRGTDRSAIQSTLRSLHRTPGSLVNFAEGTRYDALKARRLNSPYKSLLPPKVGGFAITLQSLGERLHEILDVTMVYDRANPQFWDFLCGRCRRIIVHVRHLSPDHLWEGASTTSKAPNRAIPARWLEDLWSEKDERIQELRAELAGA